MRIFYPFSVISIIFIYHFIDITVINDPLYELFSVIQIISYIRHTNNLNPLKNPLFKV